MPHVIAIDGTHVPVRDVVELGRNAERPLLRFRTLGTGDLAVFAPAGARIDGFPLAGGLAVVSWGSGAVVRAHDLRVEVRWEDAREAGPARTATRCVLCFSAIDVGADAVACYCRAPVHGSCFAVMLSCPSCGVAA